jgi:hypothetical protein
VGAAEVVRVSVVAATDGGETWLLVAAVLFGGLVTWNGIVTWRDRDGSSSWDRRHGTGPSLLGSPRQYQSWMGVGHVGVVIGPALAMIGLGDGIRQLLGRDQSWWAWWVVSVVAFALLSVGGIYVLVYFWLGVPDRLRPPRQRGWEIVGGRLERVRPPAAGVEQSAADRRGRER